MLVGLVNMEQRSFVSPNPILIPPILVLFVLKVDQLSICNVFGNGCFSKKSG
jgi:hypothetical protein